MTAQNFRMRGRVKVGSESVSIPNLAVVFRSRKEGLEKKVLLRVANTTPMHSMCQRP